MYRVLFIVFSFLLVACSSDRAEQKVVETLKDSLASSSDTITKQIIVSDNLEIFSNIEQIMYCVPLPLKDYEMDTKNEYEKAQFVFINKANKEYGMYIQGMLRSDTKVSIEEYFKNSYSEKNEEEGKIIEEKEIVKGSNCFSAKGYWSNFINEQRFIEVTWFRSEDVVKLHVDFAIKDSTLWNARLKEIVKSDSYCND